MKLSLLYVLKVNFFYGHPVLNYVVNVVFPKPCTLNKTSDSGILTHLLVKHTVLIVLFNVMII